MVNRRGVCKLARVFRKLDPSRIVDTACRLESRIGERFPGSGLSKVARDVAQVAEEAHALASWLGRPHDVTRALGAVGAPLLIALSAADPVLPSAHAV